MDEERFQSIQASVARTIKLCEEVDHLFEEEEYPSETESEKDRQAHEIMRAIAKKGVSFEYDEEDIPPFPEPGWSIDSPLHVPIYPPRLIMDLLSPPRPPPPRPRQPESCFRRMKSFSLDKEVLEKKTGGQSSEINDKQHGDKNNANRVVSKRKMKRARNMEKKRRGKGEVS